MIEQFLLSAVVLLFSSHYTITTSEACFDCPSVDMINYIFPDTSNQQVSGEIINGVRQTAQMNNHYEWYTYKDRTYYWLDPPIDIMSRAKNIRIENDVAPYKIPINSTKSVDGSPVTFGVNRWVNDRCNEAVISRANWVIMLGDTLNYMKNGCKPEFTMMNTYREYEVPRTIIDITSSYHYKYQQWIEQSKLKCTGICKDY